MEGMFGLRASAYNVCEALKSFVSECCRQEKF